MLPIPTVRNRYSPSPVTPLAPGTAWLGAREYRYPDGRIAARRNREAYQGNALVSWEVDELQIHAAGRAVVERADTEPKVAI